MAQITIYLPDQVEKKVRRAAKAEGMSVSRWIADRVVHSVDDAWPKGVLNAAGAIPDFPDLDELRRGYGPDSRREPME
jgi:hypothetical protein